MFVIFNARSCEVERMRLQNDKNILQEAVNKRVEQILKFRDPAEKQ